MGKGCLTQVNGFNSQYAVRLFQLAFDSAGVNPQEVFSAILVVFYLTVVSGAVIFPLPADESGFGRALVEIKKVAF
ncbi:hypothetical protein D3C74_459150 [compost metagenome]